MVEKKATQGKSDLKIAGSKEMAQLVNDSMEAVAGYETFIDSAPVEDKEAFKLSIQREYFKNLKAAGDDEVAMAAGMLADYMTRLHVHRKLNPELSPMSQEYLDSLEQMGKLLKLKKDMKPKVTAVAVHKVNDRNFKVTDEAVVSELFAEVLD